MTNSDVGRNDPCPCGSGKKYKKCCMARDAALAAATPVPQFSVANACQAALDHFQAGRLIEAEAMCKRILQVEPNQPDALHMLGVIASQIGMHDVAVDLIRGALEVAPNFAQAHYNLANALNELGNPADAIASYQRAIELKPGYVMALNNLGDVLQKQGRLSEAIACYREALNADAGSPLVHYNLADAYKESGRYEDACDSLQRAIALKPDYAAAYWNLALIKLLMGNFAEGWRLYEWRWQDTQQDSVRNFVQPLWLGEQPIAGKTLLIHSEQGLGDAIQFCRYAPMAEALGAKVVLEVKRPLISIASTLKGKVQIVEKGGPLPDFDLHCPIMSLPLAFKTTVASIPAPVPYLFADPGKQQHWHQQLGGRSRIRIGLVWAGNVSYKHDYNRSIPVRMLEPLFGLPVEFHSLQKEIRAEDVDALNGLGQLRLHHDELNDFSDTAALLQEMDLVISVDTSVAHLAGAMAREVWILLPHTPDYRWMLARTDSPWYPTATLFRQPVKGDWSSVIRDVVASLRSRLAGEQGQPGVTLASN